MNKVEMPEPVAFRWRVPIVDSDGRQCGESDWKFGTEKGGLPWWTRDNLITTAQAEAYADARVREALEAAAAVAEERSAVLPHYSDFIRGYANGRKDAASAIRAALAQEQGDRNE